MAEWQGNLRGEICSGNTPASTQGESRNALFEGGFVNSGVSDWQEVNPMGEGEGVYTYAKHRTACAALPDGKTMLFLEYAAMIKEATITEIKGMSLKLPNDLFNSETRTYRTPEETLELAGNPGKADDRVIASDRLSVDGALNVFNLYGSEAFTIHRAPERTVVIHRKNGPWMPSLYVDEICNTFREKCGRVMPGTVALDGGYAVAAGGELGAPAFKRVPQPGLVRMVEFRNESGRWFFAANFGGGTAEPQGLPAEAKLLAGSLEPGAAALWRA